MLYRNSQNPSKSVALLALILLAACSGKTKSNGRSGADDSIAAGDTSAKSQDASTTAPGTAPVPASTDETSDIIQLKGAALVARTLADSLGPNKTLDVSDGKTDLVVKYSSNLGNNDGLAYGEAYSDTQSQDNKATGFLLALSSIARNAALRCQAEGSKGICDCATEESAKSMLTRAVPYKDFSVSPNKEIVTEFASGCKNDYLSAVTVLFSSLAFAKRQ